MKHLRVNIGEKIAKFEHLSNFSKILFHMNCVHYFFILLNEFFLWKRLPPFLSTFIPLYIFPGHECELLEILFTEQQCRDSRVETNSLEIRKIRGAKKRVHSSILSFKTFWGGEKKKKKISNNTFLRLACFNFRRASSMKVASKRNLSSQSFALCYSFLYISLSCANTTCVRSLKAFLVHFPCVERRE